MTSWYPVVVAWIVSTLKWMEPNYLNKKIANQLINCLQQNGIVSENVGTTFMADHMQTNGDIAESNIDHVYPSKSVSQRISKIRTLDNSSSDHYPVLVNYQAGKDVVNNNKLNPMSICVIPRVYVNVTSSIIV